MTAAVRRLLATSRVVNRRAFTVETLTIPVGARRRLHAPGGACRAGMYGGTPSNSASKLILPGKVEAVAGVNLPMVIRALTYRERDLATIVTKAVSGGCEGVLRIPAFTLHNAATGS